MEGRWHQISRGIHILLVAKVGETLSLNKNDNIFHTEKFKLKK